MDGRRGDNCFFAATGITDGPLLDGVRFDPRGVTTQSLVMRSRSGTVRRIDAHHQLQKLQAAARTSTTAEDLVGWATAP